MANSIYAVILTWQNYADTNSCIISLKKSTYKNIKIVLVDNNSRDNSIEQLTQKYQNDKTVYIIRNKENYGFAKGVNTGIQFALNQGADYILLINNDAVVDEFCIFELLKNLCRSKKYGIATPLIHYYHSNSRIWQGPVYFSLLKTGVKNPQKGKFLNNDQEKPREITSFSGCVALIPRQVYEEIGLFDPIFFFYEEDVDFAFRLRQAGYKIIYVPTARAWHKITDIAKDRSSPFVMYHRARSHIIFLCKNFPLWYFIYGLFVHLFAYTPYRILQIARGSKSITAVLSWFSGTLVGLKFFFRQLLRNSRF